MLQPLFYGILVFVNVHPTETNILYNFKLIIKLMLDNNIDDITNEMIGGNNFNIETQVNSINRI